MKFHAFIAAARRDRRARLAAAVLAASPMLMAGQCSWTQFSQGAQVVVAAAADISNSLPLACQSSEGLLQQAEASSNATVAKYATTVSADVTKWCGAALPANVVAGNALDALNTDTAKLLGTGIAGQ